MSFLPFPPNTTSEAIAIFKQDVEIAHVVVHGDENAEVLTENGLVPSFKNVIELFKTEGSEAIIGLGWDPIGTFSVGFTFSLSNQVGQDSTGNWWRWNGTFPKIVTAGTNPSSDSNYKLVGDGVLRSDLAATGSDVLIADVEAGELARKYDETPSLLDFGAVGNLTTDDTASVTAAIATLEQEILVPSKKRFSVTSLSNVMGKVFKGSGEILKTIGTSIYQKLNTYADENQHIVGREYIAAWHNLIGNQEDTPTRQLIAVFSGDSTTFGTAVTAGNKINELFVNTAFKRGLQSPYGINAINRGFAGESIVDWFNNHLAGDLAANPDLLVLRWGINHPEAAAGGFVPNGTPQLSPLRQTPEQWIAVLRNGLTTIRASRSVGSLSIILMTPNSTSDSPNARDEIWYESINAGIKQAARDFNCVFIDTYAYFKDSRPAANIWMDDPFSDGRAIHPFNVMNRWINELICSVALPLGMQDTIGVNAFRNYSGNIETGSAATLPDGYPYGITISRAGSSSGFPFDGIIHTVVSRDGIVTQYNYPSDNVARSRFAVRKGRRAGVGPVPSSWDPFGYAGQVSDKPTPASGYTIPSGATPNSSLRAVIDGTKVQLEGFITKTSPAIIAAGTNIAQLPAGFRPVQGESYFIAQGWNGTIWEDVLMSIQLDGQITVRRDTTLSIVQIHFTNGFTIFAAS